MQKWAIVFQEMQHQAQIQQQQDHIGTLQDEISMLRKEKEGLENHTKLLEQALMNATRESSSQVNFKDNRMAGYSKLKQQAYDDSMWLIGAGFTLLIILVCFMATTYTVRFDSESNKLVCVSRWLDLSHTIALEGDRESRHLSTVLSVSLRLCH